MRILLVQPRMNKRPMDTNLKTQMAPSLALLTLINLTPDRHEVTVVDENNKNIDFDMDVDLVGITVTLDVMPRACHIAEIFRKRDIPVVAGGIHITCCPEDSQPHFNAICVGAAERIWERMLGDAERGCLQKVYQDMEDFQGHEVVSPAYGTIDRNQYLYTNVVTTSRGCPHRCDFCYNSCDNRAYICRPIADVVKDIETLATRHILFIDDNFIGSPDYTRELLNTLRLMRLKWSAAVTTKILEHPDLLDLMAETGCQSLFIGFESINDASLQSVHKHNHTAFYNRLVEAVHSRGIMINASMVFGLDGDTRDTFRRTLDWLVEQKIETLTAHILTPYPGTALYRRMEVEGRITERNLAKYNTAHVVFKPVGMTSKDLYDGYLWIYRQFYSFRNIYRRMPRCRQQKAPFLMFNLFYRKFGRATSFLAKLIPMWLVGRAAAKISYRID